MTEQKEKSLYEEMLEAGLFVGSHYSDLYVKDTPEAWAILKKHGSCRPDRFVSNTGEGRCLDIPFGYTPYWDKLTNPKTRSEARGIQE
jgi:hypothetical protein